MMAGLDSWIIWIMFIFSNLVLSVQSHRNSDMKQLSLKVGNGSKACMSFVSHVDVANTIGIIQIISL